MISRRLQPWPDLGRVVVSGVLTPSYCPIVLYMLFFNTHTILIPPRSFPIKNPGSVPGLYQEIHLDSLVVSTYIKAVIFVQLW